MLNADTKTSLAAAREQTSDNAVYSIGQLAKEFKVTLRSIRFYEGLGLLTPTRLGTSRLFSRRDRGRLALICRGKRLGFSLKAIKTFLDLYASDDNQEHQMRFLLDKARERIRVLEQQRVFEAGLAGVYLPGALARRPWRSELLGLGWQ